MLRASIVFIVMLATTASADIRDAVNAEVGLNTRRFASTSEQTAFRGEEMDPTTDAQSAVTMGLRFTAWLPYNLVVGLEGEIGRLPEYSGSNLAGAYGITGYRQDLGPVALSVELATGWRAVRYSLAMDDKNRWVFEPRVRAQIWASPRMTVGAAIGSTVGDRTVWMAGLYIGVHSLVYGHSKP